MTCSRANKSESNIDHYFRGSFAKVIKGRDKKTGKVVAVKIIKK